MLVIYGPSWLTVFLDSNDPRATTISRHANWDYDAPFHVFSKGLSLKWKGTGIRLYLALGIAPSLRWTWTVGLDMGGNAPVF